MPSKLLEGIRSWFQPIDSGEDVTLAPARELQSVSPRAFVVDDEDGICKLITMTLATMGVGGEEISPRADALRRLDQQLPAIIFLDVALRSRRHRGHSRARRARLWRRRPADERQQSAASGGRAPDRRAARAEHAPAAVEAVPHRVDPSRRHRRAHLAEHASMVGSTRRSPRTGSSCGISRRSTCAPRVRRAEGLIRCRHPVQGPRSIELPARRSEAAMQR